MSDIVIKAEGLGKKYLIGHQSERERYTALRDVMARNVKGLWNKTRQVLSGQQLLAGDEIEEFWALRDIDFEIKRGDRVGIIGRNGAGKSTLLKILSRITEPSEGKVTIKGRVASLLEVGTGFHPELTGRENIYLNGAILGMTRNEIKKKFDEIVDFAGVEKFLDTPVKRYSSGMYVRLAFAVAAHLEPEILVVDEVLAVGDAEFQKKCLGKMEDVSKNEGRTVLFVSHNMGAIASLCQEAILLKNGKILEKSNIEKVVSIYYESMKQSRSEKIQVEVISADENGLWTLGSKLKIKITWNNHQFKSGYLCDVSFNTIDGVKVFAVESFKVMGGQYIKPDVKEIFFEFENIGFIDRDLRIDVGLKKDVDENYFLLVENACTVSVPADKLYVYKANDAIVVPRTYIYC